MRTILHINIPEPCHEDWNTMTPKAKGRHCLSCKKTVFDFTTRTDKQIIKTFESKSNVCGRFKSSQLNRELVLSRKEKRNYLSFVASTLFVFLILGTQDVEAQGSPRVVKVDSLNQKLSGPLGISVLKERVISGTILFKEDGLPFPGVIITIENTNKETTTDFDGNFSIRANIGATLKASYFSTKDKTITITNKNYYTISLENTPLNCENMLPIGFTSTNYYSECNTTKRKEKRLRNKQARKERRRLIKYNQIKRTTVGHFLYNISNLFRKKE
ncbi:hypothetical protein A9Q86_08305 [Flavobacteriales bacterium 33_180_T64]|nr:hypothetical protein A9Q86_08305 [Flavobacteriales bacterium 33_180_T64]